MLEESRVDTSPRWGRPVRRTPPVVRPDRGAPGNDWSVRLAALVAALLVIVSVTGTAGAVGTGRPATVPVAAAASAVLPPTFEVTSNQITVTTDPTTRWSNEAPYAVACDAGPCIAVGRPRRPLEDGQIIRSTDGGETWSTVFRSDGAMDLSSVSCEAGGRCLAGAVGCDSPSLCNPDVPVVLRSTDAGATWQRSAFPTDVYVGGIVTAACATTTHCIAMVGSGSQSFEATSDDGGINWHPNFDGLNPLTSNLDFRCTASTPCLLLSAGYDAYWGPWSDIGVYDRATMTWRSASLPGAVDQVLDATCTDFLHCTGLGRVGGTNVIAIRSDDGGRTWSEAAGVIGAPADVTDALLACEPEGRCLAGVTTSAGAFEYATLDRGHTWTSVPAYGSTVTALAADGPARYLGVGMDVSAQTPQAVRTRLTTPDGRPAAPTGVTAVAGNGAAEVAWTPAPLPGDEPITGYTVTTTPTGPSCTVPAPPTPSADSLRCAVAPLDNGTPYRFVVTATNALGEGPPSDPSNEVTPDGAVPTSPTDPAAAAGDGQATVSWQPPIDDGGSPVTGYTVTAEPGGASCSWVPGPLTCTVAGLADGGVYTVSVTAQNATGSSIPSDRVEVRPSGPPATPSSVRAVAGKAEATVSWNPPWDRGSPVTNYTATAEPGGQQCSTNGAAACTVTGLARGVSYTFTVTATNANGPSPASAPSEAVVPWTGVGFHPVDPARVLDSRDGTGGWPGPLATGTPRTLTVAGVAGVPSDATAVVLNLAVTGADADSFLTAWPTGHAQPATANLNFAAGQTTSNLVTVTVGDGGGVELATGNGSTEVIADVLGWFDDGTPTTSGLYTPRTPTRALDSRTVTGGWDSTPLRAGTPRDLPLLLRTGVPLSATAVVANVTVTGSNAPSYLTIWPAGHGQPVTANLNFSAGETVSNLVVLRVGAGGAATFATASGQTDVIVDVVGWYRPGVGSRYHPIDPIRILDDRDGTGLTGPWGPDTTRELAVAGTNGIAPDVTAIVANLTATDGTDGSFITSWPASASRPAAANLLFGPGQTIGNLTVTATGASGTIGLYNERGQVHLIADAAGFYAPT